MGAETTFAVVAGGGTAGHVLPGLAVAEALVARGHARSSIRFMGARRGMEASLVPPSGFPLTLQRVHGLQRRLTLRHLGANVRAAVELVSATLQALWLFRSWRPRVVLSVGGYGSVPAVTAARCWRVPVVVVSYDAVPGRATKLAARRAAASAVAFAGSALPRAVVTGAPVRAELLALELPAERAAARAALGLPADRFTVLVFGGSLGSGALNDLADALVAHWRDRADVAVRHVVGERNDDGRRQSLDGGDGIAYQPVRYERRMDLAYAAADVVVARAGATTVAELAALGLPSVLVPWPLAAEDHQSVNARVLADVGGAVVLPEAGLDVVRLAAELERLRSDPDALAALGRAAATVGRRDAAAAVAALAEEHARS
jgi:undecaprenyldiphospho-muramoylpentapeptide beta-N-acetylglucosaminyltransferase